MATETNGSTGISIYAGPFKTASLSGMGGGYEDMCQRMLWRGVAFLGEVQPPIAIWEGLKQYQNIYGIAISENEDLKALEKAIVKEGDDVTGAMHQCVMNHLAYIHKHGQDAWYRELSEHREPDELFEWEGEL